MKESGVCNPKNDPMPKVHLNGFDGYSFQGIKNTNEQRDSNGAFSGYMQWTGQTAFTTKFKPLVSDIIKAFDEIYEFIANTDNATALEILAHCLLHRIWDLLRKEKLKSQIRLWPICSKMKRRSTL